MVEGDRSSLRFIYSSRASAKIKPLLIDEIPLTLFTSSSRASFTSFLDGEWSKDNTYLTPFTCLDTR